jgi:hypothetical protein
MPKRRYLAASTSITEKLGTDLQHTLDSLVPDWIADAWPFFGRPCYVGRDLSWPDWLALPELG